jgi:hypothetical protein
MGRTQTVFTPDEVLALTLQSVEGLPVVANNVWGHPSQVLLSEDMVAIRITFKSGEFASVYDLPSEISRFETFPVLGGQPLVVEFRQPRWFDHLPFVRDRLRYERATLTTEDVDKIVAWRAGEWDGIPDPEPIKTPGPRSRISPLATRSS